MEDNTEYKWYQRPAAFLGIGAFIVLISGVFYFIITSPKEPKDPKEIDVNNELLVSAEQLEGDLQALLDNAPRAELGQEVSLQEGDIIVFESKDDLRLELVSFNGDNKIDYEFWVDEVKYNFFYDLPAPELEGYSIEVTNIDQEKQVARFIVR